MAALAAEGTKSPNRLTRSEASEWRLWLPDVDSAEGSTAAETLASTRASTSSTTSSTWRAQHGHSMATARHTCTHVMVVAKGQRHPVHHLVFLGARSTAAARPRHGWTEQNTTVPFS